MISIAENDPSRACSEMFFFEDGITEYHTAPADPLLTKSPNHTCLARTKNESSFFVKFRGAVGWCDVRSGVDRRVGEIR